MTMTFLRQMAILPALLVVLAGLLALRGPDEGKAARRFLLFLLGMAALFLSALFISMRFVSEPYAQRSFEFSSLLVPSLMGVLALIALNFKHLAGMNRKARIAAARLGLANVVLFGLLWNSRLQLEYLILPGVLVLALGWALGSRNTWLAIALSLLSLATLVLYNHWVANPPDTAGTPSPVIGFLLPFAFYVGPGLAIVMSGLLLTLSFQPAGGRGENTASNHWRRARVFTLVLAFALPIYLAYTIFWGSVWDQTSDGIFGVIVSLQTGIIAAGVGMVMTITLRGRYRLAGPLFILIVPALLYQAFETGWRVSYHEMTERRAARIALALARFQAREGHYPERLETLTPRDLLFLQRPVILAGEEWCYLGGEDYYRLAAFYREYFSTPVSLKVYAAAGEPPPGRWECEEQLAAMKERYYSPMEDPAAMRPPLPTPLPEIEVGISKTQIQPVLDGVIALPGSWSPDSAYFVFGAETANLTLHFLNGKTDEICTADGQFAHADGLRGHHAWLPDGRLLYVDPTGEVAALAPCRPGAERLSERFPWRFTRIEAYAPENGRALLQSEGLENEGLQSAGAYWILDGGNLSVQPIPGVTPNPYELHWDTFAWLPGGERLAITRLNGPDRSEGSTLYLVSGATGQVEKSLPLVYASDQSAPPIEGLAEQGVLVHGDGDLVIFDFSSDPPISVNVLADIFGLDIDYPGEVSAAGSFVDRQGHGYYLVVRLNHPRNQATYLYHSETERVSVYDHEHHTLLLLPDGQLVEMPKLENPPSYRDEYDLALVAAPEAVQPRLALSGHTPREYPHLSIRYLAETSRIAVGSAHGVSLVSLPDGEMLAYWELTGPGFSPSLMVAPDGSAMVAAKDMGGLYYIPLPPGQ